jgi:hemerythrin-like metal-binding protein
LLGVKGVRAQHRYAIDIPLSEHPMTALLWNETLALHQPRMDTTHREFVDLLSELEASLPGSIEDIDESLGRLVEHTVEHFAQEELWMQQLGFAAGNCHAFQHAHVLQVLREVLRIQREEGNLDTVRHLVTELAKWFPVHAQTMDAGLAMTMAEQGFDTETGQLERAPAAHAQQLTSCGSAVCT